MTVNATASFTNGGTIDLVHIGTGTNGTAVLNVPSGDTLTNTGTINVAGDSTTSTATANNDTINANIDNQGTLNVGVSGDPAAYLILASAFTLTTNGTIVVASGDTFAVEGGIDAVSGTITPAGTFLSTGDFTEVGTSVSGGQVQVAKGSCR